MELAIFFGLIFTGIIAGWLGSLFGVGGGIIYIPVLTIIFGQTMSESVAISLVGILVSSAGAGAHYIESKTANIRLGMFLEIGTTIGAITGALIAASIDQKYLLIVFSLFLFLNAFKMIAGRNKDNGFEDGEHEFEFEDPSTKKIIKYDVEKKTAGTVICVVAGAYSSMTGVGGGVIKVPVMNNFMGVPLKVSTATSNYMIGITALSGAIVYFIQGIMLFDYAALIAIGSFIGMTIGTNVAKKINTTSLKKYFSIVLIASAISVLLKVMGVL